MASLKDKFKELSSEDLKATQKYHTYSVSARERRMPQNNELGKKVAPILDGLKPIEVEMLGHALEAWAKGTFDQKNPHHSYEHTYSSGEPLWAQLGVCIMHAAADMEQEHFQALAMKKRQKQA